MTERRTVLKVLASAGGAVAGGVSLVPSLAMIGEPARVGATGDEGSWYRVVRLAALEPGRASRHAVIGDAADAWTKLPASRLGAVWLQREGESTVRAWSATCPHLGCSIEASETAHGFVCRCHDSTFAADGARVAGPSPRGMDALEARVEGAWVSVNFKRFRMGVAERIGV